ncbi:MAG: hypothetical protein BM556_05595 [Bacteriovorax sp. MedPE-SWde]|nr:MAG: hypothetical protein BM556_05595 [Bacteriovorax sp. MedPE-SWde]
MSKIVCALWRHFEPFLLKQVPVYFTFNKKLIVDIVSNELELVDHDEAYREFLNLARSFMVTSESKVAICENVYKNVYRNKSSSIVLIALQILAVEQMDKDGGNYTEHAYFPRLRNLINENLMEGTSLPFDSDEYVRLWDTFSEEVRSYYSDNNYVVTFDLEATKAYKNKIMPLSQALLSHADLVKMGLALYEKYSEVNVDKFDFETFLKNEKRIVSPRGRECLSKNAIRSKVAEQFRGFISSTTVDQLIHIDTEIKKNIDHLDVVIRLEEDPFEGTFDYLLEFKKQNRDIEALVGMSQLVTYLDKSKYMCVAKTLDFLQGGNKFSKTLKSELVSYLVQDEKNINYIETSLEINNLDYNVVDLGINNLKLVKIIDKRIKGRVVGIFNGRLKNGTEAVAIEFEGGIQISKAGYSFLKGYYPEKLLIDGVEFADTDTIKVNSQTMVWQSFVEMMKRNERDEYQLLINGSKIRLAIESPSTAEKAPVGMRVVEKVINIHSVACDFNEKFICGFSLNNINKLSSITQRDFLYFISDLDHLHEEVDNEMLLLVEESIRSSKHLGKTHKEYLILRLRSTRKVPIRIINRLVS